MTEPDLGELIFDDVDPALLMQRIVDEAHALVGDCDGAAIMRCHGDVLETVSATGVTVRHVGRSIPTRASLSGLAIASGELQYSDDMKRDERVAPAMRDDPLARSLLSAPLRRGEQVIGVLIIVSRAPAAFDAAARANVECVAGFVGIALASVIDTARAVRSVFQTLDPVSSLEADQTRVGEFLTGVLRPGALEELRIRRRIEAVLDHERVRMVAQPIVELESGRVVGVEALARFSDLPERAPDAWFREAAAVGLGLELEALAIRRALQMLDVLPGGLTLGMNVSHELLFSGKLARLLDGQPGRRLLVELTEHAAFDDYAGFREAMAPLRERGVRLAIDDVGAGFSSLRHVVELAPDRMKLDRTFTCGIEGDPARRAMAEALVVFARRTGIGLVAEGIESEQELAVMRRLGVRLGQGFLIQRPVEAQAIPRQLTPMFSTTAPIAGAERVLARMGRSLRRPRLPDPARAVAAAEPAAPEPAPVRR